MTLQTNFWIQVFQTKLQLNFSNGESVAKHMSESDQSSQKSEKVLLSAGSISVSFDVT